MRVAPAMIRLTLGCAQVMIACAMLVLTALPAAAADGDIDPAWGPGGLRSLRIGSSSSQFNVVLRRAGGTLVGVGSVSSGNRSDVVVAQLDAQGHLDPAFGDAGTRVVTIGAASTDKANAALLDGNGVIAIGDSVGTTISGFLARIDSAGNLDPQFGSAGLTLFHPTEFPYVSFRAAARTPDGRILVAGTASSADPADAPQVLVARFLADGTLDLTFGNGAGYRRIDTGKAHRGGTANALAVLADGTMLIAGLVGDVYNGAWLLLRLDSRGVPVSSFGTNGAVTEQFQPNESSEADAVASDASGRVIVLGAAAGGFNRWYLVRYNGDGTRDEAFGTHGIAQSQVPGSFGFIGGHAHALLVLPDGTYAAAGATFTNGMVVHYQGDGTLDASFGTQSVASAPNTYPELSAFQALVTDNTGGFVGVGSIGLPEQSDLFATRFDRAGAIDPTFGTGGTTRAPLFNGQDVPLKGVLSLPNGDVLVASVQSPSIARLTGSGAIDASFGTQHGIQPLFVANPPNLPLAVSYVRLARQSNGRIIVGFDSFFNIPSLQGRSADGSADSSFHPPTDLAVVFGFPSGSVANGAESLAVDAQDRIVLGGLPCITTACDATTAFQVARLLPDGAVDATFGNGGHIEHAIGPPGSTAAVRAVAMQADGKIVVAGTYQGPGAVIRSRQPAVARLLPNGQLDTSFGNGGVVLVEPPTLFGSEIVALALMPDGRIVVGGTGYDNLFNGYVATRMLADGTLDTSFGVNGTAFVVDQSLRTVERSGMVVDVAGRVWFAGGTDVVRLRADGTQDSFPSGENHAQRWPAATFFSYALALQPNGRVVAVGSTSTKAASAAIRYQVSGAGLHVTPARLDFITSHPGVPTQPKIVDVEATGTGSIGVGSPAVPPGFTAASNCPLSLAAGQHCAIAVRFTATSLGQASSGQMAVRTDGSVLDPLVSLQGRATDVQVRLFGKTTQSARLGAAFETFAAWLVDAHTGGPILGHLKVSAPSTGPSADLAWSTQTGRTLDIPTNTISPSTIGATAAGTGGSYTILLTVEDTDARLALTFTNEASEAQMRLGDGTTLIARLVAPNGNCVIQSLVPSSRYDDVPPATTLRGHPFDLIVGPACPPATVVDVAVSEKAAGDIALLARRNGPLAQWDTIATGESWRIVMNDGDIHDVDGRTGTVAMALAVEVSAAALEVPALAPPLLGALVLLIGALAAWSRPRGRAGPETS